MNSLCLYLASEDLELLMSLCESLLVAVATDLSDGSSRRKGGQGPHGDPLSWSEDTRCVVGLGRGERGGEWSDPGRS